MKKLLLLLLCLPMIGISQQTPPTAQDWFDINGVKTILGPTGFMWDLSDNQYEVPKGLGKKSIFCHGFCPLQMMPKYRKSMIFDLLKY